jgi:hypothetical protein
MNQNLKNLTKNELLSIISSMKKKDLIDIINNKIGGENSINVVSRKPIQFNFDKYTKKAEKALPNNSLYSKI